MLETAPRCSGRHSIDATGNLPLYVLVDCFRLQAIASRSSEPEAYSLKLICTVVAIASTRQG